MKILSLNIRHGGGDRLEAIAAYIATVRPDAFVATEFRSGPRGDRLQTLLRDAGYRHQLAPEAQPSTNSVLIASRTPLASVALDPPPEERHRIVAANVGGLTIAGLYFANKQRKKPLFEFLLTTPAALARRTILIGDFNTGLHRIDESGATFWCADEFSQLSETFIDLWRAQAGPDAREYTWFSRRGCGFRIDHAFATGDIAPSVRSCRYDHCTRPRISDHSALLVEIV